MYSIIYFLVFVTSFPLIYALYEDEVGLNDWHRNGLGIVTSCTFIGQNAVLGSEQGVLGAVDSRTGEISWRNVVPEKLAPGGFNTVTFNKKIITTVSKNGCFLQGWLGNSGTLFWEVQVCDSDTSSFKSVDTARYTNEEGDEILLLLSQNEVKFISTNTGKILWSWFGLKDIVLSQVDCFEKSCLVIGSKGKNHLSVTKFLSLGKKEKSETETIESEEGPNGNEIIVGGHLLWICPKNNNLISIKLHSESLNKVDSKAIFSKLKLRRVSGEINLFETDTGVFKISSKGEFSQVYIGAETNFFTVASGKSDDKDNGSVVAIFQEANKEDSSVPISKIVWTLDISKQVSKTFQFPEIQAAGGSRGLVKNVYIQAVKVKASGLKSARVLVVFEDGSIVMLQLRESEKKASLLYVREEALSVISDVTSVELAVDEGSNDIHTEEIAKTFAHGNFFSILMLRMKDQIRVIKSTFASIFLSFFDYAKVVIESKGMIFVQMYKGTLPKSYQGYSSSAINSFGFKRGLVVLSKTGKLFLLNSINGEVLYGVFDPSLAIENDVDRSELIMTRHHSAGNDHPAEVAIVSSKNGRVQWRNVLTGAVLKTEYAPNKLKVISILPIHQDKVHRIEEGMKDKTKDSNDEEEVSSAAILVTVDENFKWHTYPKEKESFVRNSPSLLSKMHITYFEKKANSLNGYSLMGNGEAMQTWSYIIPQDEKLLKIQMQTEGAIANPGRKRGDGSILVKYLNNNLMMLASQNAKNEVLISILDGVSGRIIKRFSHRQARGPVHAVLFDNSVVYSFWNIVGKRQEISVVGLYEGSIDKRELNLWTPRSEEDIGMRPQFSSYDIENLVVKQRTFFVDKCISSLGISNTRHGIADRRVFIGMKNGGVNMQLRMFLDPLRPINKPTESETKELLPAYFPQLPIIPTSTITYNLTIANIDSIVSFPTKLESTTLVFVTGLDLFFSRAVPSKGFDVLNEDFSFTLLLLLSVSLLVGCVLLNNAVQSKQLNSAWK